MLLVENYKFINEYIFDCPELKQIDPKTRIFDKDIELEKCMMILYFQLKGGFIRGFCPP